VSKHVIIHLPSVGQDYAQWAMASDRGALVSEVRSGTLSEAAEDVEGRKATLILPGDDVLLAEAAVPGGSLNKALLAVPYALEDQVADDVDTLHFALGARGKDDMYPVAVIGRDAMDTVSEQCATAGLRPSEIVPETLALPKANSNDADTEVWTALIDQDHTVVRLNGHRGFATDLAMVDIMLEGARSDLAEDSAASLVVYQTDPHASLPIPAGIDVETRDCGSRLSLYANGLASSSQINLLQGDYSPKTQFDKAWKPWVWTGVLALILGGVLMAGKGYDAWQLTQQEAALDSEIEAVFKKALPNTRMQRPRAQMKNRLAELSGGSTDGFTIRLEQLAASLATQPQTQVKSISYRNGRFDLDLTTDNLPTLDALKSELQKRGSLTMTVQSANRDNKEGLRGRVRVE